MDTTFINIGKAIKSTIENRILYHPMIENRKLATEKKQKNGTITIKPYRNYSVFDVYVDMDDENLIISNPEINYSEIKTTKFVISSADNKSPYLIGTCIFNGEKKSDFIKNLSFEVFEKSYLKKYKDVLTENSFIFKYRKILDKNKDKINDHIKLVKTKKICFVVKIKYNNEIKLSHNFIEILNEFDDMFLLSSFVDVDVYQFKGRFYKMFNYEKYKNEKGSTIYDDSSIPFYSKDDFLSLYYAKSIYDRISYKISNDYLISIFPSYDDLSIEDINDLTFEGKDVFNFNLVCSTIENFIERKKKRNDEKKQLIPIFLKFDIYYRYNGGQSGFQNLIRFNGIRYNRLIDIKNKLDNQYYPKNPNTNEKFGLYYVLTNFYQELSGKPDKYMSTIIKTLQNLYQNIYTVPPIVDTILISRSEHYARIGDVNMGEFKKMFIQLFNTYKFLKTMEKENFVNNLTDDLSYKMGYNLSKFESHWRNDREMLQQRIKTFTGSITRNINSIDDVYKYYVDIRQRLVINNAHVLEHNELVENFKNITDLNFNKLYFIMGYFFEKSEFKSKSK